MTPPIVPLGELCDMDRRGLRPDDPEALRLPLLGVENVGSHTGALNLDAGSRVGNGRSTSFRFDERHVLYAKLRPYLNKVATPRFAGRCSTELVPLLPRLGVDRDFLAHLLRRKETVAFVMASVTGSRMPRADMSVLMSMHVPLPPLEHQRRIVDILNRAARIEALRARSAERLREFRPALFVRMFGERNEIRARFSCRPLREVATIASGATKGRKIDPADAIDVPYLRVANVQDGFLALSEIKTITIRRGEQRRYALAPGDLVMTEGGDQDKLGRAAIWHGELSYCAHQNHVFRVRPHVEAVLTDYLRDVAGSEYGKAYFLSVAKRTTGIASINKAQLGGFPVPVPPLALQRRYAETVEAAGAVARVGETSARTAADLMASLMSELVIGCGSPAFGGSRKRSLQGGVGVGHGASDPATPAPRAGISHVNLCAPNFREGG